LKFMAFIYRVDAMDSNPCRKERVNLGRKSGEKEQKRKSPEEVRGLERRTSARLNGLLDKSQKLRVQALGKRRHIKIEEIGKWGEKKRGSGRT